MEDNSITIGQGFKILTPVMANFVYFVFDSVYGREQWWNEVLKVLDDPALPDDNGDDGYLVDHLDIAACCKLITYAWNNVFRTYLEAEARTWVNELLQVRNDWAHMGSLDFSDEDTYRYLDTMMKICDQMQYKETPRIKSLQNEVFDRLVLARAEERKANEEAAAEFGMPERTMNLPSWKSVITPHEDVTEGRYKTAEFAADLDQVAKGAGAPEYLDPVLFFERTYVTEGMTGLLVQAIRRVTGQDGDPVIQLKTAFGGGKTHSMLALYHMMKGEVPLSALPNLEEVREKAGVTSLPKVHIAVIVGTKPNPSKAMHTKALPGVTVNTMWGMIAAQLAVSAGRPELYEYVREADKKSVSPGADALQALFDDCGPCMILLDELASYARKLYRGDRLPAGTYDNFISFIHEITEAAKFSKNSLVVASIPESEHEVAGEGGRGAVEALREGTARDETDDEIEQRATETIEHTMGRMESVWRPVEANEGFEVVRRRLFYECSQTVTRAAICNAFARMYQDNPADFPVRAREKEYLNRMIACYPIHPEIFDRLYNDWSTLHDFQRTRGVLRLMAAVIHELWMADDKNPMILPGTLPLYQSKVSDELQKCLPDRTTWHSIIDGEVDGVRSIPYQKDQGEKRFGQIAAARRAARTIFLGSAPSSRDQSLRGIEAADIRLGSVMPEDNPAIINDAVYKLQNSLSYLYTDSTNTRYWFDTRPTLQKIVEDRAQLKLSYKPLTEIENEIETRMKKLYKPEAPFERRYLPSVPSSEITDEQNLALVFLAPAEDSIDQQKRVLEDAQKRAREILEFKGNGPRKYQNMLLFVAPDRLQYFSLREEVARYLAWKSIDDEREALGLDAGQMRETKNNLTRKDTEINEKIRAVWCWLLTPYKNADDFKTLKWQADKIDGSNNSIYNRIVRKLTESDAIIQRWSPLPLKTELDRLLWKETAAISIKTLWEQLCTYSYLPRLSEYSVLETAIREGLPTGEHFAYASAIEGERFVNLYYCSLPGWIDKNGYLVKVAAAKKQIEEEDAQKKAEAERLRAQQAATDSFKTETTEEDTHSVSGKIITAKSETIEKKPVKKQATRFFLSAKLDYTRINKSVKDIVDEILSNINATDGVELEIRLEATARCENGFPDDTIQVVAENSDALKIDAFGFDV